MLERLGVDVRTVAPAYVGPKQPVFPDGSYRLANGTVRRKVANSFGSYEEFSSYPLADCRTVKDVDDFAWNGSAGGISTDSREIGESSRDYYTKLETGGLFELAWGLRGYELYLTDMILQPEIARRSSNASRTTIAPSSRRPSRRPGQDRHGLYLRRHRGAGRSSHFARALGRVHPPLPREAEPTIRKFGKTIMYHSCERSRP